MMHMVGKQKDVYPPYLARYDVYGGQTKRRLPTLPGFFKVFLPIQ